MVVVILVERLPRNPAFLVGNYVLLLRVAMKSLSKYEIMSIKSGDLGFIAERREILATLRTLIRVCNLKS